MVCISKWEPKFAPAFIELFHRCDSALYSQSFFGFGQSAEVEIHLSNSANRKQVDVKNEDGKKERLFLYYDGETVSGKVKAVQQSADLLIVVTWCWSEPSTGTDL